jgi:hypothetical protein
MASKAMMKRCAFAGICAVFLSGCAAAIQSPDGSSGVAVFGGAASYHFGGAPGCGLPISEFEGILDSDRRTGNINAGVYQRATADLQGAKASCNGGRIAEANSPLATVKARYGYR